VGRFPKKKKTIGNESGQSLVEFAMSMLLIFGFLFFFIQLSLILAWGNYVQYATFMSARAYLSGGKNRDDQYDRAKRVLQKMVKMGEGDSRDRFPMIAKGQGGDEPAGAEIGSGQKFDRDNYYLSWMQGVRYTFRSRLFLLPLGTSGNRSNPNAGNLILTSESWLSREPTYTECLKYFNDSGIGPVGSGKVVIDNGC
jgi:hypothetical protein